MCTFPTLGSCALPVPNPSSSSYMLHAFKQSIKITVSSFLRVVTLRINVLYIVKRLIFVKHQLCLKSFDYFVLYLPLFVPLHAAH